MLLVLVNVNEIFHQFCGRLIGFRNLHVGYVFGHWLLIVCLFMLFYIIIMQLLCISVSIYLV